METLNCLVNDDRPPCLPEKLTAAHGELVDQGLPGVRMRVPSFSADSSPNCFGAVIEAFTGLPIAGRMERETFAAWLDRCRTAAAQLQ